MTERIWRTHKQTYFRILPKRLGVTPRGRSRRLERALSWLGADHSFQAATEAAEELLGLAISKSILRQVTLKHANAIGNEQRQQEDRSYRSKPMIGAKQLVAQADGSMARIVPSGLKRNTNRPREWREIRLVSVQAMGAEKPVYAASKESVERSGRQGGHAALEAGIGLHSQVHVVSDGAPWIQNQAQEVFGSQGTYLVDFYHVSEYLGDASQVCRPKNPQQWLQTQQRRLKRGQKEKVFKELREYVEPETVAEEEAPVRAALRYLENRKDHLHYKEAMERGLPIGSGTIESGHKHVLQARLKKAGAAWLEENLESMARLRSAKINETWATYWNCESIKTAA